MRPCKTLDDFLPGFWPLAIRPPVTTRTHPKADGHISFLARGNSSTDPLKTLCLGCRGWSVRLADQPWRH